MVLGTVVLIEDQLDLVLLDAVAGVPHFNSHALGQIPLRDKHLFVLLGGVIDRVIDQVSDHAVDLALVAAYHAGLVQRQMDLIAHTLRHALIAVHDLRHALGDVKRAVIQLLCSAFQLGQVQHIVDDLRQPVGFLDDDVQVLFPLHRIVPRQVTNHFRIGFHHGQGRSQVVGNVGDQIPLHLVCLGKLMCRIGQRFRQIVHFGIAAALELHRIIPVCQPLGGLGNAGNGGGDMVRRIERDQEPEEHQHNGDHHGLPLQNGHGGFHRHQR